MVNPIAIGAGAAVATGLAVGFGATAIDNGIAKKHPTGSAADGKANAVTWGGALLGFGTAAGGMFALSRGNVQLGGALFGAGFGAMAGSVIAGLVFGAKHGVGVETKVNEYFSNYDHDDKGTIELDDNSFWHGSEMYRTETDSHEDSDGDTHYTTRTYTIANLAHAADADGSRAVDRPELTNKLASYDLDGNGRLQGDEYKRFDRELGEREVGWGW